MNCLIVVDAWKECEYEDLKIFPWLEQETKLFGSFLNHQIKLIRKNCDIIHFASGRPMMNEIATDSDLIINTINELPKYKNYFFCGFHLGRCVYNATKRLNKSNHGIILNLSMVYPEDSYTSFFKKHPKNNYIYSYSKGFECIDMKI